MSQQNVDLVHRLIEAFNARDLETLGRLTHDDFEFVSILAAVDAGGSTFRGPDAWTGYFAAMDQTWDEWRARDYEVFDAGGDSVVCAFRMVGKGKRSGVPVDRAVGLTYRIRDVRVWRMRSYLEPAEAFEAVGLEATPN